MNHPGFYSVVRFCPDIERGEAVNVGVIVGVSGLGIGLSRYAENALEEASDLGSMGLLFVRHPAPDGARIKLIVVAEIDDHQLRQRVDRLLSDHEVRLVEANELPSFVPRSSAKLTRHAQIETGRRWPV